MGQNQRGEVRVHEDHSRIEDLRFLDREGGYLEVTAWGLPRQLLEEDCVCDHTCGHLCSLHWTQQWRRPCNRINSLKSPSYSK